jgi:hypothetical protein
MAVVAVKQSRNKEAHIWLYNSEYHWYRNIAFMNLTFIGPCIVIYTYDTSQRHALFLKFILIRNSTCFGQIYCPSSGVSGGTRWRSWLRHCATSRKVAGSISDGVTETFHWHNPSGSTMALGLTQPLKEMSTRNITWGQRRPGSRADNLTTFMYRLSWNLGTSISWNTQGLSRPVMGLLYLYFYIRSLNTVYIAIGICHVSYVDRLLARSEWNSILTSLEDSIKTPDDGQ